MKSIIFSFMFVYAASSFVFYDNYYHKLIYGKFRTELLIDGKNDIRLNGSRLCGVSAELGKGQSSWNEYRIDGAIYYFNEALSLDKKYYVVQRWDSIHGQRESFVTGLSPLNLGAVAYTFFMHLFLATFSWLVLYGAYLKMRKHQSFKASQSASALDS